MYDNTYYDFFLETFFSPWLNNVYFPDFLTSLHAASSIVGMLSFLY